MYACRMMLCVAVIRVFTILVRGVFSNGILTMQVQLAL